MKLKKFIAKIKEVSNEHLDTYGEVESVAETAQFVLDEIDTRIMKGKDCGDVERLETAANALIAAEQEFLEAMQEIHDLAGDSM